MRLCGLPDFCAIYTIMSDICGMYIKTIRKYNKEEKTINNYYRLCESYRDENGFPKQRMVIGLGRLLDIPNVDQKVAFLDRINELVNNKSTLFAVQDSVVEQMAQHYYNEIKIKNKIDRPADITNGYDLVNMTTIQNKDVREIGSEGLFFQAFQQLKISHYLKNRGWSDEQINLATTHIISRAVYPASEYKTVSWIKENSAICELTKYDVAKITKDKLYGISKKLYKEKAGLENHLSKCTNELFKLEDKIILYELTNTYFEGRMKDNSLA